MDLSNRMYVYMDKNVLQDENIEAWMAWFAAHHRQMILVVKDVWEEKALTACPGYGYICRTVYAQSFAQVFSQEEAYHKGRKKEVLLLSDVLTAEEEGVLQLCPQEAGGVGMLMDKQIQWMRRVRRMLCILIALCLLYFVIYFGCLSSFPLWMQEGFFAFLLCIVPLAVLLGAVFYGIGKEVFPFTILLDVLFPL